MKRIHSATGRTMSGPGAGQTDFSVRINRGTSTLGPVLTDSTVDDSIWSTRQVRTIISRDSVALTNSTSPHIPDSDFRVFVIPRMDVGNPTVSLRPDGTLLQESDAECAGGTVHAAYRGVHKFCDYSSPSPTRDVLGAWTAFVPGTLAYHLLQSQRDCAAVPGTSKSVYSVYDLTDPYNPRIVRNPNCWISANMSGVCSWKIIPPDAMRAYNDTKPPQYFDCTNPAQTLRAVCNGVYGGGAMLTPRHMLGCSHWHHIPGHRVYFTEHGGAGRIVYRTVTHASEVGADSWLARLDSDLPDCIKPFKIAPHSLPSYLPRLCRFRVPALWHPSVVVRFRHTDQVVSTGLADVNYDMSAGMIFDRPDQRTEPNEVPSVAEPAQLYDSGSPIFLLIDGELVLMGTTFTFSVQPWITNFLTRTQGTINLWEGPKNQYRIAIKDLSAFPTF